MALPPGIRNKDEIPGKGKHKGWYKKDEPTSISVAPDQHIPIYTPISNSELESAAIDYLNDLGIDTEGMTIVSCVDVSVSGMVGATHALITLSSSDGTLYQIRGSQVVYPGAEWQFEPENF